MSKTGLVLGEVEKKGWLRATQNRHLVVLCQYRGVTDRFVVFAQHRADGELHQSRQDSLD